MFQSEGLQYPGLAKVVIGEKSSAELQVLVGALFAELRCPIDEADREFVSALLKEVKRLTEVRNIVIHSAWRFGSNAASSELYATTIRPRTKQNTGAMSEIQGISAPYLRHLTRQSSDIETRLIRLRACIAQRGLKISAELSESDDAG